MNFLFNSLSLLLVVSCYFLVEVQTCGRVSSTRIIGGEPVSQKKWPWQALFNITVYREVSGANKTYICGGSLISANKVLTAAHCFSGENETLIKVDVMFGVSDLNLNEKSEVSAPVSKVIIHESFDQKTYLNDVAVIILGKKLDLKGKHKHIEPICLPPYRHLKEKILLKKTYYDECYATGFGTTKEGGNYSSVLRQVILPYVKNKDCKKVFQNALDKLGYKFYPKYMLCAGIFTGGKDTCVGDSGGPWQCRTKKLGTYTVEGITSFGEGCARVGLPGGYTRVAPYLHWIKSHN